MSLPVLALNDMIDLAVQRRLVWLVAASFALVSTARSHATELAEVGAEISAARAVAARVQSAVTSGDPATIPGLASALQTPAGVFRWVRENTTFDPYEGMLRGERGTLFSRGGNALGRALLAGAMLDELGYVWRLAARDLDDLEARRLMETASVSGAWLGADVPSDARGYDPGADARRRALVMRHYWVQVQQGASWTDLDPTYPGLDLSAAVGVPAETFDAVPDAIRREVSIGVYFSSAVARGGEVLSRTAPLDETAYRNIVLAFRRDAAGLHSALEVAGATIDGAVIPVVGLERVWLQLVFHSGSVEETVERDLFVADSQVNVVDHDESVFSIVLLPGFVGDAYYRAVAGSLAGASAAGLAALTSALPVTPDGGSPGPELLSEIRGRLAQALGLTALTCAHEIDSESARLGAALGVRPYVARPRVIMAGALRDGATLELQLDLTQTALEGLPEAGVPASAATTFLALHGRLEAELVGHVLAALSGRPTRGVASTIAAVRDGGAALVTVHSGTVRRLQQLGVSSEARRRLELVVADGDIALAPNAVDNTGGALPTLAWWRIDPAWGRLVGSSEYGGHDAATFLPDGFAESGPVGDLRVELISVAARLLGSTLAGVEEQLAGASEWDPDGLICASLCDVASMRRSLCSDERERSVPRAASCLRGAGVRDASQFVAPGTSCSAQAVTFYCAASLGQAFLDGGVAHVAGPSPSLVGAFGYARAPGLATCSCPAMGAPITPSGTLAEPAPGGLEPAPNLPSPEVPEAPPASPEAPPAAPDGRPGIDGLL